jgi:mono/diheme cytochrome c family protein
MAPWKTIEIRRNHQMKLVSLALTCIAIALVAVACTETATPTNTSSSRSASSPAAPAATASVDQFATARANYKKNCEACHGPEATGGLVKVDKKQIKVPSLKADHAIKHTDEQLTKMITNGEEEMPAFKDKMSAAEIADMVRFIRKEFQGK